MSRYSSSKSNSLLADRSWIRKPDDEDEIIDRDENFGVSLLSQRSFSNQKLSETLSPNSETPAAPTRTTSVHALTKRFSASQEDLDSSSSYPVSRSSYSKSSTTKTDGAKSSTTTTTVKNNGTSETTITTTTTTTNQSLKSPTQTFTERVKSSSKGQQYSVYSPTKTTSETKTVTSNKGPEDSLYQTLIPSSIMNDFSPSDSQTTVFSTETVTVKSSPDNSAEDKLYDSLLPTSIRTDYSPTDSTTSVFTSKTTTVKSNPDDDDLKTTTITRTSSTAEDKLYDTLLPRSITSPVREPSSVLSTQRTSSYSSYTDDSPTTTRTTSYTISSSRPSDDTTTDQKRYSYTTSTSNYSSVSSPTSSIVTRTSRSDDILSDAFYTRSSSVRSDRILHDKDLCTQCRKPFDGTAKMVLADMKINCHATCFKCEVCNSTLGHMKAGDSLWIYRSMVHCDNCFEITREKWRR